jgi:hypothetical protein
MLEARSPRLLGGKRSPSLHQGDRTHRRVLLIRASHIIFARMRAAIDGLDQGADFGEGHELDEATASRVLQFDENLRSCS